MAHRLRTIALSDVVIILHLLVDSYSAFTDFGGHRQLLFFYSLYFMHVFYAVQSFTSFSHDSV